MYGKFVKTKNVKKFVTTINNLINRAEGVPGMGLIYGEPGLGKTQAALWWVANNQDKAIYVSAKQSMSIRWLLEEIVKELGDSPLFRTSELFEQIIKDLIINPKIIIVDEIDYLTQEKSAIEMLRDIHDRTHSPIILIGMGLADKKLKRYKHLFDRISEIQHFEIFFRNDVEILITELSEIKFSKEAIDYIYQSGNRFRQIVKIINKAEEYANANDLQEISKQDAKIISK